MSITNRQRGDYFERQTRDALQDVGWIVTRSAGSHGVADLVALRAGNTPLLVSCKLDGRIGPEERGVLLKYADAAGARPVVALRPRRGWVALASVAVDSAAVTVTGELKVPTRSRDKDVVGDDDA